MTEPIGVEVPVFLTSSDTSELVVPTSVVLPAGATSVDFAATPVLDGLVDADQTAIVTARITDIILAASELVVRNVDTGVGLGVDGVLRMFGTEGYDSSSFRRSTANIGASPRSSAAVEPPTTISSSHK